MLDSQSTHATEPQRWLYAGFAFRLTLGVMLVYASMETGLLASVKKQDQADKYILKDWRVKRYARKLARQSAMVDLDLTVKMRQLDREAQILSPTQASTKNCDDTTILSRRRASATAFFAASI